MIVLKVISPEGTLFEGDVLAVFLPGTLGEFEVLPKHDAIISSLEKGSVRYRLPETEAEESIAISGGFVTFKNGNMTVCVEV